MHGARITLILIAVFCAAGCASANDPRPVTVETPPAAAAAASSPVPPSPPRQVIDLPVDPPLEVSAAAVPGPDPLPDVDFSELRAAVERNPSDAAAHRELAIAYVRAGSRLDAVEEFEKAALLGPTVERLMELAAAYGFAARMPDARRTYERVLAASPDHAVAMYNLANVVFLEGDPNRAIDLYRRALAVRPDYLLATFQLAVTLKSGERFKEAYETFGRVLDLEPKTPSELQAFDNALYEMAALDIAMGVHQRAEEMLRALIEASPDHPNAHYALGQVLLQTGRAEEAERELTAHVKIRARLRPAGQVATAQ